METGADQSEEQNLESENFSNERQILFIIQKNTWNISKKNFFFQEKKTFVDFYLFRWC
jgi:hypothetical protein